MTPHTMEHGRPFTDYVMNDSRDHWPHGDEAMPPPRPAGPAVKWIYPRSGGRGDAGPFPALRQPGILGKLVSRLRR